MKKTISIFWKVFFAGLGAVLLVIVLILLFGKLPTLNQLENPSIIQASEIYAADGTRMGKYNTERGNRSNVSYRDISKHVINALIATEDERFYEHSGIDAKSTFRAVAKMGRDGGGSTITQQLAKNMLDQGSKNIVRRIIEKIKEWITAVRLERNFTKEEIITLYLNTVPFGDNTYGIRNAALTFFQKEPDRVTIDEAAVLVGMLKGNYLYNPRTNPLPAFNRKNTVIDQMVKNNYVTEEEASKLKIKPIPLNYKKVDETTGLAPYFREVLRTEMKKWCKDHINPATKEPYDIYADGLRIYTTINPRMQLYAEEAVAKQMPTLQKVLSNQNSIKTGKVWKNYDNVLQNAMKKSERWKNMKEDGAKDEDIKKSFYRPTQMKVFAWNSRREKDTLMTPMDSIKYHHQMLQTAFMVMDPATGEVKAWVGGIDFKTYKYDHVNVGTTRQVGSSIKPFLYCEALEEAGFTPETVCENTAQNFPGFGMVPAKGLCNGNASVSMATALTWSMNCASAYIMKQVTPKRFADFLKTLNIQNKIDPYPSLCLGAVDLSMFEMMQGYTMFPNRGFNTKPIFISRIEDKNGNVLESFQTSMKQVISESAAYTMCRMLQGPVDMGTAKGLRARLGAMEMGGKTGTTNDNADAWFMGFTPQLLAGTWIGCDDRFIRLEGGLGYGGQASRPIWEYFFQKVYADKTLGIDKEAKFAQPEQMRNEALFDYMNIIDQTPPPGAEGANQGNGSASEYFNTSPDTNNVPVESQLNGDEQKILKEAKKDKKDSQKDNYYVEPPKEKKKGLLRRIFGPKKEKE